MTDVGGWPPSTRSPRRRRRPAVVRWAVRIVVLVIVFVLGLALGQALDDNPDPDSSPPQTLVRTLGPLPLRAPPTVTVTVTRP